MLLSGHLASEPKNVFEIVYYADESSVIECAFPILICATQFFYTLKKCKTTSHKLLAAISLFKTGC